MLISINYQGRRNSTAALVAAAASFPAAPVSWKRRRRREFTIRIQENERTNRTHATAGASKKCRLGPWAFRRRWEDSELLMKVLKAALFFLVKMVDNLCSYFRQIYEPLWEFSQICGAFIKNGLQWLMMGSRCNFRSYCRFTSKRRVQTHTHTQHTHTHTG